MKGTVLSRKVRQKVLAAVLAGAAGAFIMAVPAEALPTNPSHGGAVTIGSSNLDMNISSTAANNVIKWQDFSIAKGETVAFDGQNYLNMVTGDKLSEIWGTLKGGGNIYLINPNGILFGAGSTVDVGTLYASTRNLSEADISAFEGGGSLPALADASLTGNIINMGNLTASQNITLEGNNLVFAGTDSGIAGLPSGGMVTLTVAKNGSVQVGTLSGSEGEGYSLTATNHGSGLMGETTSFTLVRDGNELQNINTTGNYMLAGDIDMSGESFTPIGDTTNKYTGSFNGLDYQIKNLNINAEDGIFVGLFGCIDADGIVSNVRLIDSNITGLSNVGSIAGINYGTIKNVYNSGAVTGNATVGGIVGFNRNSVFDAYNVSNVSSETGYTGGITGDNNGTINNAKNKGTITSERGNVGGIAGSNSPDGTISYTYNTGLVTGTGNAIGGIVGTNTRGVVSYSATKTGRAIGYNNNGSEDHNSEDPDTVIGPYSPKGIPTRDWGKYQVLLPSKEEPQSDPLPTPSPSPTPASPEESTPASVPVTQTAATSLQQVLQGAGKQEVATAGNVTMKDLTEAENSAAPNVRTTATPMETAISASRPAETAQGNISPSPAGDGMLSLTGSGVNTPASMSTTEVAAQRQETAKTAPAENASAQEQEEAENEA